MTTSELNAYADRVIAFIDKRYPTEKMRFTYVVLYKDEPVFACKDEDQAQEAYERVCSVLPEKHVTLYTHDRGC